MHVETYHAINNRDERNDRQEDTCRPAVEYCPYAGNAQYHAEEDRGIHYLLAIAANIMLIGHLEPAEQA